MIKKLLSLLLILALLVPGFAAAEAFRMPNETTGYIALIDDSAELLDRSEYDGVLETMMNITEYCNAGLYTYSGGSTEYVMTKARTWGDKQFSGEYTMFIIDMSTRQLAVYSSETIYQTITQSKAYTITDNVYSYASRKQYATCAMTAFNQMYRVLKGENVSGPMRIISNILLALLAAILLAYLVISARMEQEVKVSMPEIVTATVGAGAVIASKTLTRKVRHTSNSGGGGHGGFSGGGGGGFHGGGGGGSHGF